MKVGKWVIMGATDGPVTRRTFSGILPSNRSIDVVLRPRNVRIKKKHVIMIQDVRNMCLASVLYVDRQCQGASYGSTIPPRFVH